MKYWQVIAAILIWKLFDFLMIRISFGDPTFPEAMLIVVIVALLGALIWVLCKIVFRAVDDISQ